jgi:hypothetical protein
VEYDEFKAIMKAGFLQESKNPFFRFKNRLGTDPYQSESAQLTPETFVESEVINHKA